MCLLVLAAPFPWAHHDGSIYIYIYIYIYFLRQTITIMMHKAPITQVCIAHYVAFLILVL